MTEATSSAPQVDTSLVGQAEGLLDDAVALRRRIHSHPEVGLDLPTTQETVLEAIDDLDLEVSTGSGTTSVVAVLEGDQPGPTTLLRGDMDALPMPEDTGLDFSSRVDGRMHACGHDAHVAMLSGAAHLLAARRKDVRGRIIFMFQPGEEGHGGAKIMLDEGLLSAHGQVDRAFAIHVTPMMPSGVLATRGGTLMASADEFRISVIGQGGHASMPHDAVDPVPVACEIVTAIQAMVTRRIHVFDPAVVTVTKLEAGTAFNVIPEVATCSGTFRAVSDETRATILDGLHRIAEHVAAAHGCRAQLEMITNGYPVTVNDASAAARTLAVASGLIGPERTVDMPAPIMGAEDWSYVLQQVSGSMAFLGVGMPGVEHPAPNHSNRMLVHEPAMATGIAMHAAMALS
ncbi:MAG TPA: M20 family metallopeptidase [Acidimicrobiales bacterium]|nr:M20 family metallopeptidase [Acidimicrobiales bacterium]